MLLKHNGMDVAPLDCFEQPIVLKQSSKWSRIILWSILGLVTFTLGWASVTEVDESIMATGKLEPEGAVKEIRPPDSGVVREILVKDGQRVKQGDLLIRFDTTVAAAQLESQEKLKTALLQEIAFYQGQVAGSSSNSSLSKSRDAIAAENKLFRTQVTGTSDAHLSHEQQLRLQARQSELKARLNTAQISADQAKRQLQEIDTQINAAQNNLELHQKTLGRYDSLLPEGAISAVQVDQERNEVDQYKAEIEQLRQQKQRIALDVNKAEQEAYRSAATFQEETLSKIQNNDRAIAELDTQASKIILENGKKIAEIESQLQQAKLTLQYQELRAPVDGYVFELKATNQGYVANSTTPILKIVPTDKLVAKIDITNKDRGSIQPNLEASVRFDAFPFREYGDVKGSLVWIGDDVLPPDQVHQSFRFPAKVTLETQKLKVKGETVLLQSGMSVSTNIQLRQQKRTVMNIFLDQFLNKVESIKLIR